MYFLASNCKNYGKDGVARDDVMCSNEGFSLREGDWIMCFTQEEETGAHVEKPSVLNIKDIFFLCFFFPQNLNTIKDKSNK